MNGMPYGTLRDIATELKNIRKVLERMAQAPTFYTEEQSMAYAKRVRDEALNAYLKDEEMQ